MRLNLPNMLCTSFALHSDFAVSLDQRSAISAVMEQTATHVHPAGTDNPESTVAMFGSRFVISGISHRALGHLSVTQQEDRLDICILTRLNKISNALPRPPREYKPVAELTTAAARIFGVAGVSYSATFEYHRTEELRSRIALPMPLIAPVDPEGITHIESAVFSSRFDDAVRYSISVSQDADSDLITHTVDFESTTDWSRNSMRELLNQAKSISARLLIPQEGYHDVQVG